MEGVLCTDDENMKAILRILLDSLPSHKKKCEMDLLLLENNIGETHLDGLCPLSFAIENKYPETASFLLKAGTCVNTPDVNGWTPIYHAIREKFSMNIIKALLSAGATLMNNEQTHDFNMSLLQRAIMEKNVPITEYLLKQSITPNCITDFGVSPLNLTIKIESLELMKILISHGANLEGLGGKDPSPVYLALGADVRYLEELIKSGLDVNKIIYIGSPMAIRSYPTTALHVAVAYRNIEAVKMLVQNGARVNATVNNEQCTPLHMLVLKNNESNVKPKLDKEITWFLVERGADMKASCELHGTPLDAVLQTKNWTVLEVFIRNGIDVNKPIPSNNNMSIFLCAIINNQNQLVRLCVDFGADCCQSFQGKLPICFAMETKNLKTVEFLFENTYCLFNEESLMFLKCYGVSPISKYLYYYEGVKTNKISKVRKALSMGARPRRMTIHYATSKCNPDVVRALLEYGEPPTSLDRKGNCPLQIAIQRGVIEICFILLRHGACFNYCTPMGDTALTLSIRSKNKRMVKMLDQISLYFEMVKNGEVEIINLLKKVLNSKASKSKFFCYINCINKKGNTLMAEAFYHGFDHIGKEIMKLRLKALPQCG